MGFLVEAFGGGPLGQRGGSYYSPSHDMTTAPKPNPRGDEWRGNELSGDLACWAPKWTDVIYWQPASSEAAEAL